MYCPAHFQQDEPAQWLGLIEQFPLATVIRHDASGLVADHVPVFHAPMAGTPGKLVGHVARNNPLWRCPPEQELLLVFQGPSAYISPNWYATKQEAGKVVPTWNYAVVHVHATLKALESPPDVLAIVSTLTDLHEASQPHPWKVADAPSDYTERLLANIVGVEFLITRVQGKWKVSQNQPAINQQGVAQGLMGLGNEAALQMASLVKPAE